MKGIVLLDPRIPSYEDMASARKYFQTLVRKDFEAGYLNLYHLLANMEQTSNYVRQLPLPPNIPILIIMAETGPFLEAKENERFQTAQRNLVKAGNNRKLVLAKGSTHNIPNDKPNLVIKLIENFYRELKL